MKLKYLLLFILLALITSACAGASHDLQPSGQSNASVTEITPYPDTPSPARINAPLVESPAILELDMFNELEGWAVTDAEIVRTNDGGITWYDVSPSDMVETGYSVGAFFLDKDHAWILKPDVEKYPSSGTMYHTTDGGLTWKNFVVPFSEGDLSFIDSENGWMMAGLGIGAGSNAVAVFQTTDGGYTWEQTYSNDSNDPKAADSLPLGGLKSDLIPLDMKTAWVTGLDYASGNIYLYRTDNGGENWMQVNIEVPPNANESQIGIDKDQLKIVSASDGYLVLHMSDDSIRTAVYVTRDAGNTWNLTPALLDGAGPSSFLTAQDMMLYDGLEFQVTHDGAQTWTAVAPDISFSETFMSMDFVNIMSGWVITMDPTTNHRSLYRTQDGGATWLPVVP